MTKEHIFVLCHPELGSGSQVSGMVDLFDDLFGDQEKKNQE
jgi:hypothetical protein